MESRTLDSSQGSRHLAWWITSLISVVCSERRPCVCSTGPSTHGWRRERAAKRTQDRERGGMARLTRRKKDPARLRIITSQSPGIARSRCGYNPRTPGIDVVNVKQQASRAAQGKNWAPNWTDGPGAVVAFPRSPKKTPPRKRWYLRAAGYAQSESNNWRWA